MSAVSIPTPMTRASNRTIACDPSLGVFSNLSKRVSSISLIWPMTNRRRTMSRRSSAKLFGGSGPPSGATSSQRCARRRNVWKRFARARLKVSTGQFCRGSAGRAFGPAIKKSPGDIPRLSQCRLKPSVSRRVRPHLAYARSVEPSKWRDGAIAADLPAVLTRQSAYATLAVGFDREVSDIVPPSYFFEGAPTVGKKLPAPLEGELSEGAIISFLGTREGAALV